MLHSLDSAEPPRHHPAVAAGEREQGQPDMPTNYGRMYVYMYVCMYHVYYMYHVCMYVFMYHVCM